jgi:hypothetical protein
MRKHLLLGLWSISLIGLLAACNGQGFSASSQPATPVALTRTPQRQPLLPLIGTYTTTLTPDDVAAFTSGASFTLTTKGYKVALAASMWVLRFSTDGSLTALSGQYAPAATYVILGQYTVIQQRLKVTLDAKCSEFYGPDATIALYTWHLQGQRITFTLAGQDRCPARELLLTRHPWLKHI